MRDQCLGSATSCGGSREVDSATRMQHRGRRPPPAHGVRERSSFLSYRSKRLATCPSLGVTSPLLRRRPWPRCPTAAGGSSRSCGARCCSREAGGTSASVQAHRAVCERSGHVAPRADQLRDRDELRPRSRRSVVATESASCVATRISISFRRVVAPRTRLTDPTGTASAFATAARAASVARPASAGWGTRTTSAPSWSPPTAVFDALGRTWIATRIRDRCRRRRG